MNIVILHGWGHNAKVWQSFAAKFDNHNVTTLDLPGFGNEKLFSQNWDISDYATWVVKKLKSKKINRFVLVGHSFGGKIAAEVAATNPKLVKKLVLIGAAVLRRPTPATKFKILVNKVIRKFLPRNSLNIFINKEYRDARLNKLGKIFVNSVNYDATKKLAKITLPTLIIWGENDQDAPLFIAKEMNKLIRNSNLVVLKNTGHNIQFENPNILFGLIKKFIDD